MFLSKPKTEKKSNDLLLFATSVFSALSAAYMVSLSHVYSTSSPGPAWSAEILCSFVVLSYVLFSLDVACEVFGWKREMKVVLWSGLLSSVLVSAVLFINGTFDFVLGFFVVAVAAKVPLFMLTKHVTLGRHLFIRSNLSSLVAIMLSIAGLCVVLHQQDRLDLGPDHLSVMKNAILNGGSVVLATLVVNTLFVYRSVNSLAPASKKRS